MFFTRKNVASTSITQVEDFKALDQFQVPEPFCKNRVDRENWLRIPSTTHCLYSLVEGIAPNVAVSNENPPHRVWGFVADIDDADWRNYLKNLAISPSIIEETASGFGRYIWIFEHPVLIDQPGLYKAFAASLATCLGVSPLKGYDASASQTAARYWIKHKTIDINSSRLCGETVRNILVKVLINDLTKSSRFDSIDDAIDLAVVEKSLREKYPRFTEWTEPFKIGARGPTFWIDESDSFRSAIVHLGGIYTFSAAAPKAWWSWRDLLGEQWVLQNLQNSIVVLAKDIYRDGRQYWIKNPKTGNYQAVSTAIFEKELRAILQDRGFSGPTLQSAITKLHSYIHQYNTVCSCMPIFGRNAGDIMVYEGQRILASKDSRVKVQPVQEDPDGKFPVISQVLDNLFKSHSDRFTAVLGWTKYFYENFLNGNLQAGQALFLFGAAGIGKSLFCRRILAGLIGNFRDPGDFLFGRSVFSGSFMESPILLCDDPAIFQTFALDSRATFFSRIRQLVGAKEHEAHYKYRDAMKIPWAGRIVLTANLDSRLATLLPIFDSGILDKIMLIYCEDAVPLEMPDLESKIESELPYFARWLMDYSIPEKFRDIRFGVKAFHDPYLIYLALRQSKEGLLFSKLRNLEDRGIREASITSLGGVFENAVEKISILDDNDGLSPRAQTVLHWLYNLSSLFPRWLQVGLNYIRILSKFEEAYPIMAKFLTEVYEPV